ncbi:MAG TPA: RNA polymerase sigma factor [bacterium]|nr:RNA polymerase sigma factor [bacterium]
MERFIAASDEELAADLNNCPENLAILINRYQAPLSRYIFRLSGLTKEDIEDILQLVFFKLYRNINNFDPELKFSTWLYRIAHNETISHHRRKMSRPNIDYNLDDNTFNSLAGSDWQQVANNAIWRTQLNQAIDSLPEKYRQVIILRYFEDLDYQTIAEIIQQPAGTVATFLNRGKQQLLKFLTKKYE